VVGDVVDSVVVTYVGVVDGIVTIVVVSAIVVVFAVVSGVLPGVVVSRVVRVDEVVLVTVGITRPENTYIRRLLLLIVLFCSWFSVCILSCTHCYCISHERIVVVESVVTVVGFGVDSGVVSGVGAVGVLV